METLLDVVKVKANPDYTLYLEFENGETRIFDMALYMDKKPFVRLKELPLFARAFVDYGTVVWPGNIDIAPKPCMTCPPQLGAAWPRRGRWKARSGLPMISTRRWRGSWYAMASRRRSKGMLE
ncbi:MAG: DUF2442 domain-containing protein [Dechloromonas sp.]|nr:DUF2442 domain-containing protein [Dechloromonas sp.]